MFETGQSVVYRTNICKIIGKDNDYYLLQSLDDQSLSIKVPIDCSATFMREIISKEEVERIINEIPSIKVIEADLKNMESEYINLLKSGSYKDLIAIIKTAHLRNEERTNANKKLSEKDSTYFNKAEKLLYSEFAIALGLSYEETKEYVVNKVNNLTEKK